MIGFQRDQNYLNGPRAYPYPMGLANGKWETVNNSEGKTKFSLHRY
jgi:hypothetical protein